MDIIKKTTRVFAGIAVASIAFTASAQDSVTINGQTTNCTNSCEVTTSSDGSYKVRDCCGGRIWIRFNPIVQ